MTSFTVHHSPKPAALFQSANLKPLLALILLAFGLLAAQSGWAQGFSTTAIPWALPAGGYATSSHDYSYYQLANTVTAGSISALEHTWATLDMNGDTKPDIVVLTEGNGNYNEPFGTGTSRYWKVYLNTGGSFMTTATTWVLPTGGRIVTHLGRSASFDALEYAGTSYTGNQGWAVKDMNGDSRPDLVVLTEGTGTYNEPFVMGTSRYWKVYLNTGSGFSTTAIVWTLPEGGYIDGSGHDYGFNTLNNVALTSDGGQKWSVLDMNGDNRADLAVMASSFSAFGTGTSRYWKVYLNNGAGYATAFTAWGLPAGGHIYNSGGIGGGPVEASFYTLTHRYDGFSTKVGDQEWSVLDMNGDARPDIAVIVEQGASYLEPFGTSTARYWKVFLNTGTGFSTTATNWPLPEGGGIDPATGRHYSFNWIWGNGSVLIGNQTWDIQDLTGDGRLDLVILREGTGTYDDVFGMGTSRYWKVYANTGTGYATSATNWGLPAGGYNGNNHNYSFSSLTYITTSTQYIGSQTWATLDMNGDARADLVVLTEQGATHNEPFGTGAGRYWKVYLNSATSLATRPALGTGNLELFPNPASHAFTLRLPALGTERTAQLTLLNSVGQAVHTRQLELRPGGTDAQIDISALAAGLYTMRVQAGSQVAAQPILVE